MLGPAITQMNPLQSKRPSLHARLERVGPRAGRKRGRKGAGVMAEWERGREEKGWWWGWIVARVGALDETGYVWAGV